MVEEASAQPATDFAALRAKRRSDISPPCVGVLAEHGIKHRPDPSCDVQRDDPGRPPAPATPRSDMTAAASAKGRPSSAGQHSWRAHRQRIERVWLLRPRPLTRRQPQIKPAYRHSNRPRHQPGSQPSRIELDDLTIASSASAPPESSSSSVGPLTPDAAAIGQRSFASIWYSLKQAASISAWISASSVSINRICSTQAEARRATVSPSAFRRAGKVNA